MNIDGDRALDLLESGQSSLSVQQAIRILRAERRQIQQDLSEAQELSRIREAQIKEELDCISSFQLQLQDKEEELSNTLALADLEQLSHKSSMELYRHDLDDLRQGLQAKEEENRKLREAMVEYLSAYDGIMRGGLAATERLSIALSTLRQALEETDAD